MPTKTIERTATAAEADEVAAGRAFLARAAEVLHAARRRLGRLRARKLLQATLVTILILLALSYWGAERARKPIHPGREVTLDVVTRLTPADKVRSATLYDYDSRVVVSTARAQFWASYPRSDSETNLIVNALERAGASVRVDKQAAKASIGFYEQFLLPILILANLFGLLFAAGKAEGGAAEYSEFSKVRAGRGVENSSGHVLRRKGTRRVTFADVGGAQGAVVELAEVVEYLRDPTKFQRVGALPPKGVLLFGPPGCGKTLLARAVAGEADVPFYSLSGSEFVESLVGVGAARVRDLFDRVRRNAPAIVFIDELDAAGRRRGAGVGGGNDEREQTLNQILVEMDGFETQSGVVVIGATNRPDILDPALLRPGRFDRHITVDRPDIEGRFDILRLYSANRPLANDIDLELLARRTAGLTGADLANVWNEAALLAVRADLTVISMPELTEAIQRVMFGPKRSSEHLSADERALIAVHEAGHAVVAAAINGPGSVERLSIARRGLGLGHAWMMSTDQVVLRRSAMQDQMTIAIAGRAVEEIVYGETSTGSEADIERATDLAKEMAGRYGFTDGVGPVRVAAKDSEVFLGRDLAAMQMVAPETLSKLDQEIRRLVEEAQARAAVHIGRNRSLIERLALRLCEAETLEGDELRSHLELVADGSRRAARRSAPSAR